MLCSAAELELSDDHEGIIELPDDAPVGVAYGRFAGLDDPVIDVAVTPNRPDAAGVAGIARDLAAAGLGSLKTPAPRSIPGAFDCPTRVHLDFALADKHLCPAFALRLVRGVTNGPSPEWMQKRLSAIGLRPISALVDITNYITFDRGRPLHVFDLAKVKDDLAVRRARSGESVLALDGKSYALDDSMVVIADENGVESIAEIIGGEHSGCDQSTRHVLIESALWDPANIALTGRKLGIMTDARYRFERGVDPEFCVPGLDLATEFVLSICGGEPSRMVVAGDPSAPRRSIPFPYSEVKRLLGVDIPRDEGEAILARLGFGVGDGTVVVPSWRPDVQVKADVVEQILRIAGVDRAPTAPLPRLDDGVAKPVLTLMQKRTRLARRTLAALSLREAVTWSFVSKTAAELFGGGSPSLALANPIAADLSDMRPSLVPGLVAAAERNARRALSDVALFEVGQVFLGPDENDQRIAATAVRRSRAKADGDGRHWSGDGPVDIFDAKRDAMTLLRRSAKARTRSKSSPAVRRFFIPAVRRRCNSGRRLSSAGSDSCTRAPSKRSTPRGRSSPSRSSSTQFPRRRRGRPRPSRSSIARTSCRSSGTSHSLSTRRSRRRHRQGGGERRTLARRQGWRIRRLSGRRAAGGRQVDRHPGDPATARADPDRRRNRRRDGEDRGRGVEEDRRHSEELRPWPRAPQRLRFASPLWPRRDAPGPRTIPPARNTRSRWPTTPALPDMDPRPMTSGRILARRSRTALGRTDMTRRGAAGRPPRLAARPAQPRPGPHGVSRQVSEA